MIRKSLPVALTLLAGLATNPAAANIETISASQYQYTPGTDVSNALPGATLSALVNYTATIGSTPVIGVSDVTTIGCGGAFCAPGTTLFTPLNPPAGAPSGVDPWYLESGGPIEDCIQNQTLLTTCKYSSSLLKVSFANPTNFVQATYQTENDRTWVMAFNSNNQLLNVCQDGPLSCWDIQTSKIDTLKQGNVSLLSSSYDISTVYIGGWTSVVGIDSVSYNRVDVPEPGTLALFGAGLAAIGLRSRKRVPAQRLA